MSVRRAPRAAGPPQDVGEWYHTLGALNALVVSAPLVHVDRSHIPNPTPTRLDTPTGEPVANPWFAKAEAGHQVISRLELGDDLQHGHPKGPRGPMDHALENVDSAYNVARSTHGQGSDTWTLTFATDDNADVEADAAFRRYTPDSKQAGHGMEVKAIEKSHGIGSIFALRGREGNATGIVVHRMRVVETPVVFPDESLKGVSRYEVELYNDNVSTTLSVGTLAVLPEAFPDKNTGKLYLAQHVTRPKLGTAWTMPDGTKVLVAQDDVDAALEDNGKDSWDQKLHATVEAAMYRLRTDYGKVAI